MIQLDIDLNEVSAAQEILAQEISVQAASAQTISDSEASEADRLDERAFKRSVLAPDGLSVERAVEDREIEREIEDREIGSEWGEVSAVELDDIVLSEMENFSDMESMPEAIAAVSSEPNETAALGTLMVDLVVPESGRRVPTLVKGKEDGKKAIALSQWLVPFDDATRALGMAQVVRADGEVELRSPDAVIQVDLASGTRDPEIGYVWSVAEIEKQLGTAVRFDRDRYALQFNQAAVHETHPETATLAPIDASAFTVASAKQRRAAKTAPSAVLMPSAHVSPVAGDMAEMDVATADSDASSEVGFKVGSEVNSEVGSEVSASASSLGLLLVGLSVGDINTVEATLVRGREDGTDAVLFDQWLIPFDDAIAALGGHIAPQADGSVVVRAPGLATSLNLAELPIDPDLGATISIADIAERFGIAAEFSLSDYAVRFLPPVAPRSSLRRRSLQQEQPVITEGLPVVSPSAFSLSGIRQVTRFNSSQTSFLSAPSGQLKAVGSAFGGSWYMQLNQPKIGGLKSWQLREFQYFRQSQPASSSQLGSSADVYSADYVLGSQQPFWQSLSTQSDGQAYWGATTVQRWGFTPPAVSGRSGFDPQARVRSHRIGRTVSGEAAPGTFVQLTLGLGGPAIDETIVDSSGVYRFENLPASGQLDNIYSARSYVVNLYANGQLSGIPETRSASFLTLPGQLPRGASALVASAGMGHRSQTDNLIGNFQTFKGGLSYRRGLTESLTVGAGLVQDGSPMMMAEAFYLPENVPFQAAVSAMVEPTTGKTRVDADVRYQPRRNLKMAFNSDRFSQRFKTDWTLGPALTLSAGGDSATKALFVSARTTYRLQGWSGSANASIDTRQNFRWRLSASRKNLSFSNQGSELFTYSELAYRIPSRSGGTVVDQRGHKIVLGYETRRFPEADSLAGISSASLGGHLATAEWRYYSPQRLLSGQNRWSYSVGYGVGTQGSGPLATVSAAIGSGLSLQMRYQSVNAFSDRDTFQVSLVSQLNTQNGLSLSDSNSNQLRTSGGVLIQPFLDTNNNGDRDAGEPMYLEAPNLLMQVNHRSLRHYRAEVKSDGVAMSLAPATYRLDIDPAGLPLDRTARKLSYAIEVVPGQYTTVPVPLALSYTVSGVVVDSSGEAVSGARVEAISASGHRQLSITNGAGVYYLERLRPEAYDIQVNGAPVETAPLELETETNSFLEREIHML